MKGGYYYCLKSGKEWFGINNRYGTFSNPLHIGYIIGGSVYDLCNIPTLLYIGTKTEVML